jgi:opacity protein-like surface antigen
MLSRRIPIGLALGALLLASAAARAQDASIESPRWNYELRGAYFLPDLEHFDTFYGDDSASYWGLALTYRLRDRLELGGEYGLMKETGVGLLTETGGLGGSVEYRLDSFHVFANVIFQRKREQRVVPYLGVGLLAMRYEQEVELQPDIEGSTDLGWAARAGLRFRLTSHGPEQFREPSDGSPYWRSYLFLEAQRMSAKADEVELGGDSLLLGFRMEFDLK